MSVYSVSPDNTLAASLLSATSFEKAETLASASIVTATICAGWEDQIDAALAASPGYIIADVAEGYFFQLSRVGPRLASAGYRTFVYRFNTGAFFLYSYRSDTHTFDAAGLNFPFTQEKLGEFAAAWIAYSEGLEGVYKITADGHTEIHQLVEKAIEAYAFYSEREDIKEVRLSVVQGKAH